MASSRRLRWTFSGEEGAPVYAPGAARTPRTLTADDIRIVYQPIVELGTGRVFAYEALTRCSVPELANPMVLFEQASAEKSTGRLGRLIREAAVRGCPGHPLFVNIHPDELAERWLVRPDDPLAFHDAGVFLEITETAAFQYYDLVQGVLKEVCSRTGAQLVVDDFGAGYSNLRRIIDLEPQIVKLDRALVAGLDKSPRQQCLVRHMVGLCGELGAQVVAEGIETPAELRAVREAGVGLGQGYVLARPAFPPPLVENAARASARPPRASPSKPAPRRSTPSPSKRSRPSTAPRPSAAPRASSTPRASLKPKR